MKLKRAAIIFGSLIVLLVIFTIYSARDLPITMTKTQEPKEQNQNHQWQHFESRIRQLESDLSRHHNAVAEIKAAMQNVIVNPPMTLTHAQMTVNRQCHFQIDRKLSTDVQMLDLYKVLQFDNPDGGAWKQGWRIEVDEKEWNRKNKLKVFVVPHSHNDPGWIRTFDEYFATQTKHILDNMLAKLPEDARRKFIWAEISFFALWWQDLDKEKQESVKQLLKNGQLEIVTGGWVMNDEANAHYLGILHQLSEGHEWLKVNLNVTPRSHWSIDPFGMSLTQPAILKSSGLENMLIQRVHYSVKKEMARKRHLEFNWRQLWDPHDTSDIFCHMMPFYGYDIPHTCGPDPKICCQFDFKRLPDHGLHCPWKVAPQKITEENVAERAALLLDQYRKKSKLFRTNVVLAPLGDDFRYDHATEWDVQYANYQKLFDYMNSKMNLNVQAQFGTLSDYFDAVRREKSPTQFPVLSGDFFTYADRDDHYWSGYYTSRPFYKRMDRVLIGYVRAAETILALTSDKSKKTDEHERLLVGARRSLALFQHHDGITGTAKDHVVVDYGKRMLRAIHDCQHVIQSCVNVLLGGPPLDGAAHYGFDDVWRAHDALPEKMQITIGLPDLPSKNVVIFNPLAFARREVVTFNVNTPFIEVFDFRGKRVSCQVSPIFEYASTMSQTKYEMAFVADVPPLATVTFTVNAVHEENKPKETSFAKVKIYNRYGDVPAPKGFDVDVSESAAGEFTIRNGRGGSGVAASFNKIGLLKAVKVRNVTVPVHLDFAKYGVARRQNDRSGAYLFLPDGDAVPLLAENAVVNVIQGPVLSTVAVQLPYVLHKTLLHHTTDAPYVEIQNHVDIEKTHNFELVMRVATNIESGDEFFTDVNGYQMVRRQKFKKLPLQANYYPMPTKAYIEDEGTRLTVVTGTPLGCSSLSGGKFEVMLDRRLGQDDNLGLGQGVLDNRPTRHVMRLLVEKRTPDCHATASNHPAGFPTLSAAVASDTLLNPLVKLIKMHDEEENKVKLHAPAFKLGVDVSLVTIKTNIFIKGSFRTGLVLHRQYLDTCFADTSAKQFPLSQGTVNLKPLFPQHDRLFKASLTFLTSDGQIELDQNFDICPMEFKAFYV